MRVPRALVLGLACIAFGIAIPGRSSASDPVGVSFVQPAGTVAVNFSVDDRLNRIYGDGDLKWKGSFGFDPSTRILTFDPFWSGGFALEGFPTLYDDGPWTRGGHEPEGAQPGDHVWGVTVFVAAQAWDQGFDYGLIDAYYEWNYGNGWMWSGPNGHFDVLAGASAPVNAAGMLFPKFGKQDLRFTVDTKLLRPPDGWTWDTSWVGVKSSWWGWAVAPMTDEGDGVWSTELGGWIDAGVLMHTGLLKQRAGAEFVVVIGGSEYVFWYTDGTSWWPEFPLEGLTVSTRCKNGVTWSAQPITFAMNGNPFVIAPEACAP